MGDRLDPERMQWQLDRLAGRGVSGVQVNYAHAPHAGGGYGLTYPSDPPIFTEPWWRVWDAAVQACAERGLRIGLSDYTLAWPGNHQWIDKIAADPEFRGAVLEHRRFDLAGGATLSWELPEPPLCVRAYPVRNGQADGTKGIDLGPTQTIRWQAPADSAWLVVALWATVVERSIDPLHPRLGERVVAEHFQRFADRLPEALAGSLDYFFQDELMFGLGDGRPWSRFLAPAFRDRHGYDLIPELPAVVADLGPRSVKVRMDLAQTITELGEAGYFKPVHQWHAERGMTYGCDQMGRGMQPQRYGDYMRSIGWFSAPGHDTPGVGADLVKGKVSSSIAHLNRRPRVWLEGYHSAGWGMEPGRILAATVKNYVFGCSLLSLHGLYYSTHGSHWEWAPPCYHFRMPYWEHFAEGLRGIERLSWLLTRGVHRCDVAVLYPVAPLDAGLATSPEPAFAVMRHLVTAGLDADFIDDAALATAHIDDSRLCAADERFRVLILADLPAMRHASLEKAVAFVRQGGLVVALGRLPHASERSGNGDPEVAKLVESLFGTSGRSAAVTVAVTEYLTEFAGGGAGAVVADPAAALELINRRIPRDCIAVAPMFVLHRHFPYEDAALPNTEAVSRRVLDLWFLVGAKPGATVTVRSVGCPELWNPWTGSIAPLPAVSATASTTTIRLPDEAVPHDAWIVVMRAGAPADTASLAPLSGTDHRRRVQDLDGLWDFELQPTMDNTWGDFRLPITETLIGAEARRLRLAPGDLADDVWIRSDQDDRSWPEATCGFGPQAWRLDLPEGVPAQPIVDDLRTRSAIDPARPWTDGSIQIPWNAQEFSWRWGPEGDPGGQGYHGLKGVISDDVLALGDPQPPPVRYSWESLRAPGRFPTRLLWTTLVVPGALAESGDQTAASHNAAPGGARMATTTTAEVLVGGLAPSGIWLDGVAIAAGDIVEVSNGARLLIRYDGAGHGHVVLRRRWAPAPRRELASRWWCDSAILPWAGEPRGGVLRGRCLAPPGLNGFTLTVHARADAVSAWVDGVAVTLRETGRREDGSLTLAADWSEPRTAPAVLAVRVVTPPGWSGASVLPEPIRLRTGCGRLPAGDWAAVGALRDYSGSAWYRRTITIGDVDPGQRFWLDLGQVSATAAVRLNAKQVGVLLSAPWRIELTGHLRPGDNLLEIQVCNTLANHYRTIPTRYPGDLTSGLIGPVQLITESRHAR
ncbi:hypothetical protein LBMAG53_07910 [Planctomycetota bacterium]|nr:hypothetical protein LBMAG53_07910 [Planctomycetota bacterium]